MSDDRQLLEAAAKAAGIELRDYSTKVATCYYTASGSPWNPLERDGDALRLAVKLNIDIRLAESDMYVDAGNCDGYTTYVIDAGGDRATAVRRSIVRVAAAIGEKA